MRAAERESRCCATTAVLRAVLTPSMRHTRAGTRARPPPYRLCPPPTPHVHARHARASRRATERTAFGAAPAMLGPRARTRAAGRVGGGTERRRGRDTDVRRGGALGKWHRGKMQSAEGIFFMVGTK